MEGVDIGFAGRLINGWLGNGVGSWRLLLSRLGFPHYPGGRLGGQDTYRQELLAIGMLSIHLPSMS